MTKILGYILIILLIVLGGAFCYKAGWNDALSTLYETDIIPERVEEDIQDVWITGNTVNGCP